MMKVKCKGCPREIIFAHDSKSGARVPIDPVAPVYRVAIVAGRTIAFRVNGKDAPVYQDNAIYGVTHYATCPKANEFGRSKRLQDAAAGYQPTTGPANPLPPQGGSGLPPAPRGPRPAEERARILEDLAHAAAIVAGFGEDGEIDITAPMATMRAHLDRLHSFDGAR